MAEDKDKQGNELLGQDFLGDMQGDVSNMPTTGLFDKLAKLGAQQRLQPAVNVQSFQKVIQPTFKLIEDAEERIATAMTAYTLANPEIDDSKLFDATGDLVTGTMTDNNARFKELNRKLGYMSPQHPDYAKTVQEITKIQETSVNLRNDNAKLLGIRNAIKELDVQEMSKGQTPGQQAMYNDILVGNKENFQTIDGKLHWVNPSLEDGDPNKSISVESMNAAGPTMADDAAFESHYDLMSAVRKTKAEELSDQDLNYQVNTMFKSIGNDGLKSLIFDSGNADTENGDFVAYSKNGMMFNTNLWWNSLYSELGVEPNSEKAFQIRNDIQQNGVMHNIEIGEGDNKKTIRVKEHFRNWYSNSLKQVEKIGDGKPEKAGTNLNDFDDPRNDGNDGTLNTTESEETNELITNIAGPKLESGVYQSQTGSGINFGDDFSPFAGITQYGWGELSANDHIFELGKGVPEALTKSYSEYGFEFSNVGNVEDVLLVKYDPKIPGVRPITKTFEFDNYSGGDMAGDGDKDHLQAIELQKWMHEAIGYKSDYSFSDDDLKAKLVGR